MGIDRSLDYLCPQCDARNHIRVWTYLDTSEDPDAVRQILDGRLFEFLCRNCGQVNTLDHALQLHDPAHRLRVWLDPPDDPLARDAMPAGIELPADYRLRKVDDMNAFRELVQVWNSELDDAAMLLLKHMLATRVLAETGVSPVLCSFDGRLSFEREEWMEYIVFQTEESEEETMRVPFSVYVDLAETIKPIKERLFPDGRWVQWNGQTVQKMWKELHTT